MIHSAAPIIPPPYREKKSGGIESPPFFSLSPIRPQSFGGIRQNWRNSNLERKKTLAAKNVPAGVGMRLACRFCNSTDTARTPGRGPHSAGLKCNQCGAFRWLRKAALDFIQRGNNMSMQLAAHGRLGRDPKHFDTANGKGFAVSSMAVSLPNREAEDGFATLWLKVLAFGREADALMTLGKGDPVTISGRAKLSSWKKDSGEVQQDLELIADSIVAARSQAPEDKR